ncbi:MAG: cell division protein SepF [Candidatus Micrarchaeota archaeon]|nr:cell division protein SepF [Candidatus Micrarchaeota archaeon]
MGLLDKLLGKGKPQEKDNVNIEDLIAMEEVGDAVTPPAKFYVKKITLRAEGDVEVVIAELKQSNIVILDYDPLKKQQNRLNEILTRLGEHVRDLNGDMAAIKNSTVVIITPSQVKIAKSK